MANNDKSISQLTERTTLTGEEMIPFAEAGKNGKFKSSLLQGADSVMIRKYIPQEYLPYVTTVSSDDMVYLPYLTLTPRVRLVNDSLYNNYGELQYNATTGSVQLNGNECLIDLGANSDKSVITLESDVVNVPGKLNVNGLTLEHDAQNDTLKITNPTKGTSIVLKLEP